MLMQGFRIIKRVLSYQKEVKRWTVMDKDMGGPLFPVVWLSFLRSSFLRPFVTVIRDAFASFIDMGIVIRDVHHS